jgi:Flp pilus assembly protein TadG
MSLGYNNSTRKFLLRRALNFRLRRKSCRSLTFARMDDAMRRKSEAGQAIILTALMLTALMGFAGLAIDMGVMRYEKRLQQTAADAAAIAGASNLASSSGGVIAGAQNAAAANGFTDNGGGAVSTCAASGAAVDTVCVQINNPPQSGPHSGNAKYVEALVADVHTTYFMKILGISTTDIIARAVATNLSGSTASGGCLFTLGPPPLVGIGGSGPAANINAPTCGIEDNGNFDANYTVHAGTIGVAGTDSLSARATCTDQPGACPAVGMPAATNPLSQLTPPCSPCSGGSSLNLHGGTVNQGTYQSISLGPGAVVFNPGLYIIDGSGGLSIGANATVTGNGVTFYFTNGATVSMNGTPTVNLTAPGASGQYPGILFYQDPADTAGPVITGDASSTYDGVLYFPTATVTFKGNSSIGDVAIVVADALALSGNPTVNLEGNAGLPSGVNVILDATLVE